MGMGEGLFKRGPDRWIHRPTYDSASSDLDLSFPLDAFVNQEGMPFFTGTGEDTRPFNGQEIDSILSANLCIGCHDRYEDRIYDNFSESNRRFEPDSGLPCQK